MFKTKNFAGPGRPIGDRRKIGDRKANMKKIDDRELAETTGGVVWWIPVAVGAAIYAIVKDWDDFKQGILEGLKTSN